MNEPTNNPLPQFQITVVDRTDEWSPESAAAVTPTQCITLVSRAESAIPTQCIPGVSRAENVTATRCISAGPGAPLG